MVPGIYIPHEWFLYGLAWLVPWLKYGPPQCVGNTLC